MNKWLKILLGVAAAVALIIAAVFYITAGMTQTADAFFTAVKHKDIATARGYLAEDFKASTDEKALADFLSKGAILNFRESSWSSRQVSGGRGELDGSITTDSGGVVPIHLVLVKEHGAWKIYSISKPAAGLQTRVAASASAPLPPDSKLLAKQSMHDFIVSVGARDMTHFRDSVSALWQKQFTTQMFADAFQSIMDSKANWSVLENFEPVFLAEPTVDDDGVLLLTGRYDTTPEVHFEQKYVYEGVAWKLIGFSIKTR